MKATQKLSLQDREDLLRVINEAEDRQDALTPFVWQSTEHSLWRQLRDIKRRAYNLLYTEGASDV